MARIKPTVILEKVIGKHKLRGEQFSDGRWLFFCATMRDLATKYDGAPDTAECFAEFERRALGQDDTGAAALSEVR